MPVRAKRTHKSNQIARLEELSEEEANTYHKMVEDFDKEWEKILADQQSELLAYKSAIASMAKMYLLKMPKSAKNVLLKDYFPSFDGVTSDIPESKTNESVLDLDERIEEAKNDIKSAKKSATARKKQKANAAVGKTPARTARGVEMPPPSSATVRRSTRKKIPSKYSDYENSLSTPLNTGGRGNNRPLATPMITPKFDINTPMSRTVMRLAKPNETLMSLSGSPVYSGATTVKKTAKRNNKNSSKKDSNEQNMVEIPLGEGKTMILPVDMDSAEINTAGLDLDDEEKSKLMKIKDKIASMLNMK